VQLFSSDVEHAVPAGQAIAEDGVIAEPGMVAGQETGPVAGPGPFDPGALWQNLRAIPSPGPAPDVTADGTASKPSARARRALRWRSWQGPLAFLVALGPAALSFSIDVPTLGRLLFFAVAVVLFFVVRSVLRRPLNVATFVAREREAQRRWQAVLAEWEAKAGPRRFDDKWAELQKLTDWWMSAESQPQHRERIEGAMRKASDELHRIATEIEGTRTSMRHDVEIAYAVLLQTQLDLKAVSTKA
jgi:hypothetical protein